MQWRACNFKDKVALATTAATVLLLLSLALLLLLVAVHSAIHGDIACSTTSVQIMNCGAQLFAANMQAIETSLMVFLRL